MSDQPEILYPDQHSLWRGSAILHWISLAMAGTVLLLSFLMHSTDGSRVFLPGFDSALPSICATKVMLGIDCPGCGLTRAFIAISHGEFLKAWNFNHASFVVYAFVAVQIPWHLTQLWRRFNKKPLLHSPWVYLAPISLVVVLLINWVLKIPAMLS